jgi:hypothetical protein
MPLLKDKPNATRLVSVDSSERKTKLVDSTIVRRNPRFSSALKRIQYESVWVELKPPKETVDLSRIHVV